MAKQKNYRLLTTAIVTAINPSEQTARGAVWTASEKNDQLEADALVKVGIAEAVNDDATVQTVAERNAAKQSKAQATVDNDPDLSDEDTELLAILSGSVDEVVEQLDGLDGDQLERLAALEAQGKGRKGVADAIAQYTDAE